MQFQGLAKMNRLRALLFGFAATVGAGGIAAYNGVFSNPTPPAQLASTPGATPEAPKAEPAAPAADPAKPEPAKTEPAKTEPAKTEAAPAEGTTPAPTTEVAKADPNAAAPAETPAAPAAETPAAPAQALSAPTFDVLRVEPDGSVLIAGNAGPDAQVEVLSGADVLGAAKAGVNGDFAITLAEALKPGDYQLVLRATGADGKAATSVETATVSVPETLKGEVLALVEEPGKPSRIITAPEKPVETAQADTAAAQPAADPAKTDAPADAAPAATAEVKASGEVKAPAQVADAVVIEAVETEGGKIFIAGSAKGVAAVRIYANDEALGDAKPGEGDRFLGEFTKDLPVGDYIIKAEGLAADGVTVISTASVPFQRQADTAAPAADTATKTPAATDAAAASSQTASDGQAAPAPAEATKPKAVIIRRGDTLWQISRRIYGRGVRYSTIYLANPDVTQNPNRIFPGQVFKVPEKTPEGEAADPVEVEKRAAPAENAPAQ